MRLIAVHEVCAAAQRLLPVGKPSLGRIHTALEVADVASFPVSVRLQYVQR